MYEHSFLFEDYCNDNIFAQGIEAIIEERQTFGVSLPDAIQYRLMHTTSTGTDTDAVLDDLTSIANSVFFNNPMEDDESEAASILLEEHIEGLMEKSAIIIEPYLQALFEKGNLIEVLSVTAVDQWLEDGIKVLVAYEDI